MVRRWYEECCNYDYASPGWRKDAVHFTQMVWRATTDIGVGVAKMDNSLEDKFVVVVHYYPAGKCIWRFMDHYYPAGKFSSRLVVVHYYPAGKCIWRLLVLIPVLF